MNVRKSIAAILVAAGAALMFSGLRAQDAVPAAASLPTPTTLPIVTMALGGKPFTLEVADDPAEQERGLMFRREMPADHGMIFVFRWADVRSFWMKNTYLPLDIIYLDDEARVLNVEKMVPLDLSGVGSDGRARYAIELNAGVGTALGLKRGEKLALPDALR